LIRDFTDSTIALTSGIGGISLLALGVGAPSY